MSKTKLRTENEIKEFYLKHKKDDFLGFRAEVLVPYLSFENAKEFLTKEAKKRSWEKNRFKLTEAAVKKSLATYLEFAFGKALDHRGISAERSIEKLSCWLWVLGDEELYNFAQNDENYPNYGMPILKRIAEKYELPIPEHSMVKRMAKGLPCVEGCTQGCGK